MAGGATGAAGGGVTETGEGVDGTGLNRGDVFDGPGRTGDAGSGARTTTGGFCGSARLRVTAGFS